MHVLGTRLQRFSFWMFWCTAIMVVTKLVDGYLELPERPGLGIDLNWDVLEKYPFQSWHRPFSYREDSSLAYQ